MCACNRIIISKTEIDIINVILKPKIFSELFQMLFPAFQVLHHLPEFLSYASAFFSTFFHLPVASNNSETEKC